MSPRIPLFLRRTMRLLEARRALFEGAPERALSVLEDPSLSLSRDADMLRTRAMQHLWRDAVARSRTGRDGSVARILRVVAGQDPVRAREWRQELAGELAVPSALASGGGGTGDGALGEGAPGEAAPGEGTPVQPSPALRDLLADQRLRTQDVPVTPTNAVQARPAAIPPPAAPPRPPGSALRFHLAVDDGGEFLVLAGPRVVVGHARAGRADLGLLADLEAEHALLELTESFHGGPSWRLAPVAGASVVVDERQVDPGGHELVDGDLVELSPNAGFRVRRPDSASGSIVLELEGGAEAEGTQHVLLLVPGRAGRVRIGPRRRRHVPVAGLEHDVQLVLDEAGLAVRCSGGVRLIGSESAQVEVVVPCPPAARIDLSIGARPSRTPPFGVAVSPSDS